MGSGMAESMNDTVEIRVTGGLLALTLTIGGAGLSFPLLQMLLGLSAIAAATYYILRPVSARLGFTRPFLLLVAGAVLLPVLQLVPLPPSIWKQLPGRETALQLDFLLGWRVWRPWSLDIEATIRSVLVLIPGIVIFVGSTRLGTNDRIRLIEIIVGFAIAGALLGIAQYASGGRFTPFPSAHLGYPIGLFVNRNHQAVFLLIAIPLAAALSSIRMTGVRRPAIQVITVCALVILAIAIIATTSRMALVMLPFVITIALAIMFKPRSMVGLAVPTALGLAALAVLLWASGGFSHNFVRFSSLNDARFDYWADLQWALGHYGLAGTGIGTFVPVQKSAESLASVTPAILNHAHNDFIELLLEGGIPAVILLFAFFVLVAGAVRRKWQAGGSSHTVVLGAAASAGIIVILVFSLVDYPLRMPAIAADFAVLMAMMLPLRKIQVRHSPKNSKWFRVGALVLVPVAVLVVQAGVSSNQLQSGNPEYAAQWADWSTEAHERLATKALIVSNNPSMALSHASQALRLSPIDAPAIRTVGILSGGAGGNRKSFQLMHLAVILGWRDPITNLWAIETARQTNEPEIAVQRAEALYLQHQYIPEATASLFEPPIAQSATAMLIRDLASKPDWRRGFLRSLGELPAASLRPAVEFAIALNRSRSPATLDEAGPLLNRLSDQAFGELARPLWLSLHAQGLVANGAFERINTYRGPELPTDWDMSDEDISSISIDRPGFGGVGKAVRFYDSRYNTPLIAQSMMLEPGSYVLAYRVRSDEGAHIVTRWEFRCLDRGTNAYFDGTVHADSRWQSMRAEVTVPVQECRNQRLAFELTGPKRRAPVWLDDVALDQRILTSR
jgi:O-antigen ligase